MKYDILFAFFLGSFSPENSWIKITKTVHKFKKILFKIVCFSYSYVSIYTQYEIWLLTSLAISFCVQMFYFVLCSPIFVVVAISVLFLQLNTCVNVIAIISIILFFSHYHPAQFIPGFIPTVKGVLSKLSLNLFAISELDHIDPWFRYLIINFFYLDLTRLIYQFKENSAILFLINLNSSWCFAYYYPLWNWILLESS